MKHILTLAVSLAFAGAAAAGQPDKKAPPAPDGLKSLKHPDPTVRYNSVCLLIDLGPVAKFAIPALREALQDKSPRVRVKVAEALWHIEKPPARVLLPALLDSLKEKDEVVRADALLVLARLGPAARKAIPEITQALKDKDVAVRMNAVLALGTMGAAAKGAIPALLDVLRRGEQNPADTRFLEPFVSLTLVNLGAPAVPALTDALGDKDPGVRRAAAYALGMIGPESAPAAAKLTEALADREGLVRALAAEALGRIGAKAALPKLEAALKDKDTRVRVSAALALYQVGGRTGGLPVLNEALGDKQALVREQACVALGEMGKAAAASAALLYKALGDREPRVRAQAAYALGKLPPTKEAESKLTEALADKDEDVRLNAARSLWRARGMPAQPGKLVDLVAAALESDNAGLRKRAAMLLWEFGAGAKAAVPALVQALRDRDPAVREAASTALRRIDPQAADRLGAK